MLRLTLERKKRNWSQARLAREARLNEANISKMEHGYLRPYPRELARLAEALGVAQKKAHTLLENVGGGGDDQRP